MPFAGPLVAAHQQVTHDWWGYHREMYELVVAQPVIDECQAGDPEAAEERMALLQGIAALDASPESILLAEDLPPSTGLPPMAVVDALHISIAAMNGIFINLKLQTYRQFLVPA
jgi:hypothetical protein